MDAEMTPLADTRSTGLKKDCCYPTPSTSPTTVPPAEDSLSFPLIPPPKEPPVSLSSAPLVVPVAHWSIDSPQVPSDPHSNPSTHSIPSIQQTSTNDRKKNKFKGKKAGKRCGACSATSTPQWRRGPMGARTLCNACGVKYSQGRPLLIQPSLISVDQDQRGTPSDDQENEVIVEKVRPNAAKVYYKSTETPNVIQKVLETPKGMSLGSTQVLLHASPVSPVKISEETRALLSMARTKNRREKQGYKLSKNLMEAWINSDLGGESESSEEVLEHDILFSEADEATILSDFVETVHEQRVTRAAHKAKLHL